MQLLAVAEEMLEGELAYRRGEHDAAFDRLRAAKRAFRVRVAKVGGEIAFSRAIKRVLPTAARTLSFAAERLYRRRLLDQIQRAGLTTRDIS